MSEWIESAAAPTGQCDSAMWTHSRVNTGRWEGQSTGMARLHLGHCMPARANVSLTWSNRWNLPRTDETVKEVAQAYAEAGCSQKQRRGASRTLLVVVSPEAMTSNLFHRMAQVKALGLA